ncbi:hypothetical protein AX14_006881 [Amanita brunnescens Koide BX004]|nr:hypothetical protein AX14_006881 [Amanita brunnescens Koide BX004]
MLSRRLVHRSFKTLSARPFSTPSQPPAPTKAGKEAANVPVPQSPNFATTWTTSQRLRPGAGENPRFEQTAMDLQPNPLSAMELIANEPVRLVHARKAICDGGSFTLSHSPSLSLFSCLFGGVRWPVAAVL